MLDNYNGICHTFFGGNYDKRNHINFNRRQSTIRFTGGILSGFHTV